MLSQDGDQTFRLTWDSLRLRNLRGIKVIPRTVGWPFQADLCGGRGTDLCGGRFRRIDLCGGLAGGVSLERLTYGASRDFGDFSAEAFERDFFADDFVLVGVGSGQHDLDLARTDSHGVLADGQLLRLLRLRQLEDFDFETLDFGRDDQLGPVADFDHDRGSEDEKGGDPT